MSASRGFVLAYDADCGPCSTFKGVVSSLDWRRRMRYLPLRAADAEGLLEMLPAADRFTSAQLVSPEGRIFSGAQAIPEILRLLPGGWMTSRLAGESGLGRSAVRFVYGVASRLHDAGACSARTSARA